MSTVTESLPPCWDLCSPGPHSEIYDLFFNIIAPWESHQSSEAGECYYRMEHTKKVLGS